MQITQLNTQGTPEQSGERPTQYSKIIINLLGNIDKDSYIDCIEQLKLNEELWQDIENHVSEEELNVLKSILYPEEEYDYEPEHI